MCRSCLVSAVLQRTSSSSQTWPYQASVRSPRGSSNGGGRLGTSGRSEPVDLWLGGLAEPSHQGSPSGSTRSSGKC